MQNSGIYLDATSLPPLIARCLPLIFLLATAVGANSAAPVTANAVPREISAASNNLRTFGEELFVQSARRLVEPKNLAALKAALERDRKTEALEQFERFADIAGCAADPLKHRARIEAFEAFARSCYADLITGPLLFVKRQPYSAQHIYDSYLTFRPGGGIYRLETPLAIQREHRVTPVIDASTPVTLGTGVYRDPDLHYDGERLLFAFKGGPSQSTCIYEMNLNGAGLRRLTDPGEAMKACPASPGTRGGSIHHDINPCYLPDGRIVFTSTRSRGLVMCFNSLIDILHTMNADGSDLRCISVNNVNEFDPAVLPDGRVLYGCWEYLDKTALYIQSLWSVRPDGSDETSIFANNLAKPTALLQARPVPGSHLIAATLAPHNGQPVGAIAMIDARRGKNNLAAITNLTPEFPIEIGQGYTVGNSDPFPLSENVVLFANNQHAFEPPHDASHPLAMLELVDRSGFRMVLHYDPEISCFAPLLVRPRKRDPVLASMIKPGEPACFLVHDIYQNLDGIKPGEVKWLRVLETTSRLSGIPAGGRWWNQAFLVSWQGSYDIKRFLGIVPVEPDGSAYFQAPPGRALYFQALDKDFRMIQSQRTFVQAVEGVTRSCVGCHSENDPGVNTSANKAAQRTPSRLQPESWGGGFLTYWKDVQPVLDRHCVSCHGGEKGMGAGLDLGGGWTWAFNISYESLLQYTQTGFLNCGNGALYTAKILPPRTHGSGAAPLAALLLSGHGGRTPQLTPEEKRLLFAWMDANSNYYGSWDYTTTPTLDVLREIQRPLQNEMSSQGCVRCHEPAPENLWTAPRSEHNPMRSLRTKEPGIKIGNDWINLQHPERSRILRAPLQAGAGLGLGWCRERKARQPSYSLLDSAQPPHVQKPASLPVWDRSGQPVVSFASEAAEGYQRILKIIQDARARALAAPRIDMPGAVVISGMDRPPCPLRPVPEN